MNDEVEKDAPAHRGATSAREMSPEAMLRIRRLLTLYVASLITFPVEQPSHFQLCHPETALEVKSIPKEIIGLRRQYLKEIHANIRARQNYQDLLASRNSDGGSLNSDGEVGEGATRLETHLKLLQMRERRKEVQITRHYLEKLRETNPAKDGGLDFRPRQGDDDGPAEDLQGPTANGGGSYHEGSTEALMKKLEREVIRAKYQLEREKRLLADVKAKQEATKGSGDNAIDPRARIRALAATRDELVRFLEEKMSSVGLKDNDVPTNNVEHDREPALDRERVHEQINTEYDRYIAARKRVLDVAAKALSTPAESGLEDPVLVKSARTVETRADAAVPVSTQSTISPLPFISEQLVPLLHSQKATALQESYTSRVLKMERAKALDNLERLADESHLLPAYPIMARQERFKNLVTALGGPRKLDQALETKENDEMIRRAEAWAFAAEEAKKAEEDFVMEKIRYGNERLDGAGCSLALLDELLGEDPRESAVIEDGGGEADIWLETAGGAIQNTQSRRPRPSQQEKGPWAGLSGKIGIADRKER